MLQNLMFFSIFSLIVLMIFPAYAAVDSVSLEKSFYTNEELLTFVGVEEEGRKAVFVIVRGPSGNFPQKMCSGEAGFCRFSTCSREGFHRLSTLLRGVVRYEARGPSV